MLSSLVSPARITRLVEQEAIDGAKAYRPTDMMADLRKGVWRELDASQVRIDAYRRALQRTYLDVLGARLNGPPAPAADEARGLIRAELKDLGAAIAGASRKAGDRATGVHLQDARDQIARILDPKFNPPTPAGASAPRPGLDDGWPEMAGTCWPDYIIRAPKK